MARAKMSDKMPRTLRGDAILNAITGVGTSRDKRTSAVFSTATLCESELDELFREPMFARICEVPARDMTREGFDLVDVEPDVARGITAEDQRLGIYEALKDALLWARVFGAGLIVLGADDGRPMSEPLDLETLVAIEYLSVLDRFDLDVSATYGTETINPYGRPERYRIRSSAVVADGDGEEVAAGEEIHESRILRFDGIATTRRQKARNGGWNDGMIQRVYSVVVDFVQSTAGLAHLLTDASQGVLKIRGLADLLMEDGEAGGEGSAAVRGRLVELDRERSLARMLALDAEDEDFERKGTPLTDYPATLDRLGQGVALAAEMPVTLLFGIAPSGLQATGDSDQTNWNKVIRGRQKTELTKQVSRLLTLLFSASEGPTGGDVPDGWGLEWSPLSTPTAKERAETAKLVADTDAAYLDRAVYAPSEVRTSRAASDDLGIQIDEEVDAQVDALLDDVTDPPTEGEGEIDEQPDDSEAVDPTTALNGAQVSALLDVISQIAKREIPRSSGVQILSASFPFDIELADQIVGEVGRTFFAPEPEPTTATPTPATEDE